MSRPLGPATAGGVPTPADGPVPPTPFREPRQARSAATLARILQAAEQIATSGGLEQMTIAGVAERAGVAVGSIYRRFEDKEQLVAALIERMLQRREQEVAERLRAAEPTLASVLDAYTDVLLRSFVDSTLFAELLRARARSALDRGGRTITAIHRLLLDAAEPYVDEVRRADPRAALDTVARAILGACFHNAVRPDRPVGEAAQRRYADELVDMALAYLRTPDRRSSSDTSPEVSDPPGR